MHYSASITISGIPLVPRHLRANSEPGPSSARLSARSSAELPNIVPDLHTTRPAQLSGPKLERWRSMIVRGIFGRFADAPAALNGQVNDIDESSRAANRGSIQPIPHFDGAMFPSWPEQRFPLPLPTPAEQATDMVYILQAPDVRGKFDVARAAALNVPKGPIRGRLTKGETISFDDPTVDGGVRVVRPEDCLTGGGPGKVGLCG